MKNIFQQAVTQAGSSSTRDAEHGHRLAVASLLIEVIQADHTMTDEELIAVRHALSDEFSLNAEDVQALMTAAETSTADATSLFEFTTIINKAFSHAQKVDIMQMLWRAAYADGTLEKHEAHLLRRLADLLHIRHREYIAAKLKAQTDATRT